MSGVRKGRETRHVAGVPTSPGDRREKSRRSRRRPIRLVLHPRSNSVRGSVRSDHSAIFPPLLPLLPFHPVLFTRIAGTDGGEWVVVVRHHPTLNRTRRQYAGNFTEPLASRTPAPPPGLTSGAADFRGEHEVWLCMLGLISGRCPIGIHRNWILLSAGLATRFARTIAQSTRRLIST